MGPTRCPETSVNSYHTTPRNIPEERRSQQLFPWAPLPFHPSIRKISLRAASDTAARRKGTIAANATQSAAPHVQPLLTTPVPVRVAGSVSSAATFTTGQQFWQRTFVEIVHLKFTNLQAARLKTLVEKQTWRVNSSDNNDLSWQWQRTSPTSPADKAAFRRQRSFATFVCCVMASCTSAM
jgi:hypothetical protein